MKGHTLACVVSLCTYERKKATRRGLEYNKREKEEIVKVMEIDG
jgi:hypothetical protein